jgi:hypothetical protein
VRVNIKIDDMPEAEALKLSEGVVSERIKAVARKSLLAAREEHELTGSIVFTERSDGAWEIRDGVEIIAVARHYVKYWQCYIRRTSHNIRRSTWPLLKLAIEEHIRDAKR